jgi:hypothetical protein
VSPPEEIRVASILRIDLLVPPVGIADRMVNPDRFGHRTPRALREEALPKVEESAAIPHEKLSMPIIGIGGNGCGMILR